MSHDYPDREHWLKVRKAQRDPGYKALLTRPDTNPTTGRMTPLRRAVPKYPEYDELKITTAEITEAAAISQKAWQDALKAKTGN